MRCFIAIDIGEANKEALSDLQRQLRSKADTRGSDVKWVRPDNVHLTLKFLGEIKDEKTVEICNAVKEVAGRHKSFELDIESVGYFGGRRPSVLWIGMGEGSDELSRLQEDIEGQLALAGWPEEKRKFNGHLTLCRIRNPKAGVRLVQVSEEYKDFKLGVMSADSVCVYQSQLTPSGPVYTLLGEYNLQ